MLIFKYLQIFLIKMVESGICDDQANQAGVNGHIHVCKISNMKFPIVPCYQLCALISQLCAVTHYFATADPKIG